MPYTQQGINHELLSQLMREKNLTPVDIYNRRGVPEQTVKNIVGGKTGNPGIENLAPICEELGIPIEDVLFSKTYESRVIKDNPSAEHLKEMYEFQMATIIKSHENEMAHMREHYETQLKEQKEFFEKYATSTNAHYEQRLQDKRDHIATCIEDKNWFRLAAVVGVIAVLALFLLLEFAMPGHGWFTFEEDSSAPTLGFIITLLVIIMVAFFVVVKKKKEGK